MKRLGCLKKPWLENLYYGCSAERIAMELASKFNKSKLLAGVGRKSHARTLA